ncbi:hypothetical protein [Dickeya oryzae]|uniref:Uncharacterized protein n=1 Tax=Dickeya oryzae TaxID=1240404 RepID=A0AB39IH23_9GAMM|nr:hypothetical protein [Dickeya oryzae]MBP2850146.1 hypothetical protein [Dickeya oryzae]MBP2859098.1 hypothetical protein [Dickeya oryzae]MCA6993042.1 hypothetical protein [Dickeya oryzae]
MLIKMLSDEKKALLVDLARLLTLSDNPLRWDGKTKDELTSDSNLNNMSIHKDALETALLEELEQYSAGSTVSPNVFFGGFGPSSTTTEHGLIEKLKSYPLAVIDAPETRIQAATAVLKILLADKTIEDIATPKIILFQLFLVALKDGQISSIEWMLLKEIQIYFKIPDFIFKDLLDRAEALNNEMSKTIALILE